MVAFLCIFNHFIVKIFLRFPQCQLIIFFTWGKFFYHDGPQIFTKVKNDPLPSQNPTEKKKNFFRYQFDLRIIWGHFEVKKFFQKFFCKKKFFLSSRKSVPPKPFRYFHHNFFVFKSFSY